MLPLATHGLFLQCSIFQPSSKDTSHGDRVYLKYENLMHQCIHTLSLKIKARLEALERHSITLCLSLRSVAEIQDRSNIQEE